MIQTIGQLDLLDLPFGDERLDYVRLIRDRAWLIEAAADGDEIGERANALEGITDARQKRIGLRRRRAAEQPLQWRVDRERGAPRVGAQDCLDAGQIVVEFRVRGRKVQNAERADEIRVVSEDVGLRRFSYTVKYRFYAFLAEVQSQVELLRFNRGL